MTADPTKRSEPRILRLVTAACCLVLAGLFAVGSVSIFGRVFQRGADNADAFYIAWGAATLAVGVMLLLLGIRFARGRPLGWLWLALPAITIIAPLVLGLPGGTATAVVAVLVAVAAVIAYRARS